MSKVYFCGHSELSRKTSGLSCSEENQAPFCSACALNRGATADCTRERAAGRDERQFLRGMCTVVQYHATKCPRTQGCGTRYASYSSSWLRWNFSFLRTSAPHGYWYCFFCNQKVSTSVSPPLPPPPASLRPPNPSAAREPNRGGKAEARSSKRQGIFHHERACRSGIVRGAGRRHRASLVSRQVSGEPARGQGYWRKTPPYLSMPVSCHW